MMPQLKQYLRVISTSSHNIEEIVNVLARGREHLSHGRYSLAAELIKKAEQDLVSLMGVNRDEQP